jgi:hypothetical protein
VGRSPLVGSSDWVQTGSEHRLDARVEALNVTTNDAQQPVPDAAPGGPTAKAAGSVATETDPHEGANFDIVAMHYYASRDTEPNDPARATYRDILRSWETREGSMTSFYFCENIMAAAAITDRDCLFSVGDPYRKKVDLPLYRLITRADHLGKFIEDSLVGHRRRAGIREVYAIETNALRCMDALAAEPALPPDAAEELRAVTCAKVEVDLLDAEQYAYAAWQRRAQMAYLQGMGLGILGVAAVVLAVTVLLAPLFHWFPEIPQDIEMVPWVLLLGAIGAVLSVMQRLTKGNLRLRLDSTLSENRTLGAFRPVIGSALALGLLILVLGGLIPLEVPINGAGKGAFFLAGLAFLAGFSERFAQDMIGVATSTRPSTPDAKTSQAEVSAEGAPAG